MVYALLFKGEKMSIMLWKYYLLGLFIVLGYGRLSKGVICYRFFNNAYVSSISGNPLPEDNDSLYKSILSKK